MKEIEKYIGYYLLVYLVVLAFCGFFQYMYECQGQSLSCAFSKDGFNTIITTTAYVLTPIVAIIGFLNWKQQHNKLILADEAKKLLLAINNDIKLFTDISGTLRNKNKKVLIQDIYDEALSKRIRDLSDNITNVSSKALILYELSHDDNLNCFRYDYSKFMHDFHCRIVNDFQNNLPIQDILAMIDFNKPAFFQNNATYKQLVRNYIIVK
ncbi:hypothetical protein SKM54_00030 [Acinetobacter faecalis]|uniref:hypothetical protein n=1 Tax=Acinetobacter faecalis TaxID=2665161 RepID=UPI002A9175E5|nr:hypothetical protein [Acinetobacter faecalis]MDY6457737.1 hypothetical protein [Acinetobacter faecalis]MDY6480846.1 hypothetical protein [Acinetobacter faecalis]